MDMTQSTKAALPVSKVRLCPYISGYKPTIALRFFHFKNHCGGNNTNKINQLCQKNILTVKKSFQNS